MYPTNNVSIPLTDAVRGIETLFVGYMFHNPWGAASVRGIETLFVGYNVSHTRGGQTLPPPGYVKHVSHNVSPLTDAVRVVKHCTLQTMFQYPGGSVC